MASRGKTRVNVPMRGCAEVPMEDHGDTGNVPMRGCAGVPMFEHGEHVGGTESQVDVPVCGCAGVRMIKHGDTEEAQTKKICADCKYY